ncbi:formyltransferase family protein [Chloroflexus sp.]|uniref:formyltransferase family protein n=1 Tax=Chloroflexus sp. TaxID=1904827 RepID=UPI0026233BB9|nr:formyltransferase family protein [uncultured Chloroflexus sp.]
MTILFLGPGESPLVEWLKSIGEEVIATTEPVDLALVMALSPDFIVSYGYRHIIKKDVLALYQNRAINLHISYLPWNRGADPNFWSFVEDTPKGVTIHYLDEGVDTGDIIAQRKVTFSETDTLRTSYDKLQAEIQALFKEHWLDIRSGSCNRHKQQGKGTYHRMKDKTALLYLLFAYQTRMYKQVPCRSRHFAPNIAKFFVVFQKI